MNRSLRTRRDDRGVVALELVIAMPFLLMLIIGAVVMGIFMSTNSQAVGYAREGARAAAIGKDPNTLTEAVEGRVSFTVDTSCPDRSEPDYLDSFAVVTATKDVPVRGFPVVGDAFLPETVDAEARMRCGG